MKLTLMDVMTGLERLLKVYTRPKSAPESPHDFATLYYEICRNLSRGAFGYAIDAYLETDARFFPKPGELCALARKFAQASIPNHGGLEAEYNNWERNGMADGVPCPVCGARLEPHTVRETPEGEKVARWFVAHDHDHHATKRVGYVGRRSTPSSCP